MFIYKFLWIYLRINFSKKKSEFKVGKRRILNLKYVIIYINIFLKELFRYKFRKICEKYLWRKLWSFDKRFYR